MLAVPGCKKWCFNDTCDVDNSFNAYSDDKTVIKDATAFAAYLKENKIHFSYDKHDLDADDKAILGDVAEYMMKNPDVNLRIEGHTDIRGTREYNLGLGERRAHAVHAYLKQLGVNESQLKTLSYGKEHPLRNVTSNDSSSLDGDLIEQYHAENRRAELIPVIPMMG